MRLIDADKLKMNLTDKSLITWTYEYGNAIPVTWIMSEIDNAPTVETPCNDCCADTYRDGYEKGKAETRPQGEWIPITTRQATEEEKKKLADLFCINPEDLDSDRLFFSSPMPENEQEILISTAYGVAIDRCLVDETGTSLDERGDWDGVTAWMPLPDKYEGRQDK